LKLPGVVSAETAKQIGKVLGVDAVISGTLLDIQDGLVEINARLIKTETAEVLNTGFRKCKKDSGQIFQMPRRPLLRSRYSSSQNLRRLSPSRKNNLFTERLLPPAAAPGSKGMLIFSPALAAAAAV